MFDQVHIIFFAFRWWGISKHGAENVHYNSILYTLVRITLISMQEHAIEGTSPFWASASKMPRNLTKTSLMWANYFMKFHRPLRQVKVSHHAKISYLSFSVHLKTQYIYLLTKVRRQRLT